MSYTRIANSASPSNIWLAEGLFIHLILILTYHKKFRDVITLQLLHLEEVSPISEMPYSKEHFTILILTHHKRFRDFRALQLLYSQRVSEFDTHDTLE